MIIARYRYVIAVGLNERIHIVKDDGGYWVWYDVSYSDSGFRCAYKDGPYKRLSDAESALEKKKVGVMKLNGMCDRCIADCRGSANMIYSGCVLCKNAS